MPKQIFHLFYLLLFSSVLRGQQLPTPLGYNDTSLTLQQSFNTLPVTGSISLIGKGPFSLADSPLLLTGLEGWFIRQMTGSQSNTNFSTSTGSSTGSGVYSFGPSGNINRALGTLASGTGIYGFGIILKNETGIILNHLTIQFLASQWRKGGSGNINTWKCGFIQSDSSNLHLDSIKFLPNLNLSSIHTSSGSATLNGQLPINQNLISNTITDIRWLPGQYLVFQWSDADETGSDDAMAIDDFSFKATQEIGPPTIGAIQVDSISSRSGIIKAIIDDQLAATNLELLLDTSIHFTTPISIHSLINAGTGPVLVTNPILGLLPKTKYYFLLKAINQSGTLLSSIDSFTTTVDLPIITTDSITPLNEKDCIIHGTIIANGGSPIIASGFCWGRDSLFNEKTCIPNTGSFVNFNDTIFQLPTGTAIYFQAYGTNEAGIAFGKNILWHTPTIVQSFERTGNAITNLDTVYYRIYFKDSLPNISAGDFQLSENTNSDATIVSLTNESYSWLIAISTGNSDGIITPVFLKNNTYQPVVFNAPFAANQTIIDKTKPFIKSITYDNKPYKAGDTIQLTINLVPEKNSLELINGSLAGYPLQMFTRLNDSCWKSYCVVKTNSGSREINASENLSATIRIRDQAGNENIDSIFIINYDNDPIDLTRPKIERIVLPEKMMYKSGDSLFLQILFTEAIKIDSSLGSPLLSITIGTRVKNPYLYRSYSQSLEFCYIIQPDELDMDGIRISNTITLNNAIILDLAGNQLINQIPNAGVFSQHRVDAVAPIVNNVITPAAKNYGMGDTISFSVFISKPLIIPSNIHGFGIQISAASNIYKALYIAGTQNPLKFYWIVPPGVSDKKGISISSILMNCAGITDSSGNDLFPVLRNIGSMSNIIVDGIVPLFMDSSNIVQVCSKGVTSMISILQAANIELGENIEWSLVKAPSTGIISGLPASSKWTSNNNSLPTISYSSSAFFARTDECIIQVSDGINSSRKKIFLQVNEPINVNRIASGQVICAGFSAVPLTGDTKGGNGVFEFKWESADTGINKSFVTASGQFNQASYFPLNLQQSMRYRRIAYSGGCVDSSAEVLIQVKNKGLWLGNSSDSWHHGANWCGALVPDQLTDVYLSETATHRSVKITDSAFAGSIFAAPNTSLQINGTLVLRNNITGNNNIDARSGTLITSSKEKQALKTGSFLNKSVARLIAKGTELEIIDTINVTDYLSIQKGQLNTNNKLILSNNASNYPNAPGTILKGDIQYHHLINGRDREQFLHHPFQSDLPIYPKDTNRVIFENEQAIFTSTTFPADNVYTLGGIQQTPDGLPLLSWQKIQSNPTFQGTKWAKQQGIILSIPGTIKNEAAPISLLFKGRLETGDVTVEYPASPDSNFIFTGNPLLADIHSKNIIRSEGIGNYYWIWDTSMAENGAYRTKAFNANNRIKKFEGYIIKTIPDQPIWLTYPEQSKMVSPIPDSLADIIENTYQMEILLMHDSIIYDQVLLLDTDIARTRFDAADAEKIANPGANLYTLSADSIPLAIDARWMTNRTYIPLCIHANPPKQFSLKFSRTWLKPGIQLELHDHFTGRKMSITKNKSYDFEITSDTASFGSNRFVIRSPIPPEPIEEPLQLQLYPVPSYNMLTLVFQGRKKSLTTILVKTLQGQLLISRAMGEQLSFTEQVSLSGLLRGTYLVEVHSGKLVIAKTFIKL